MVPPDGAFGLGGAAGRAGAAAAAGVPGPVLVAVVGAFFCACFSLRAFCVQSGQVTSLAFADWNHLPQVMQRNFVLLMRELPCTRNLRHSVLRRNALSSIAG